jgi:hypothetical protein
MLINLGGLMPTTITARSSHLPLKASQEIEALAGILTHDNMLGRSRTCYSPRMLKQLCERHLTVMNDDLEFHSLVLKLIDARSTWGRVMFSNELACLVERRYGIQMRRWFARG